MKKMVPISPQLTWTVYRYIQQLVGQFVKVVYLYHIAKANEPNEGLALNKGQCEPNQGLAYNKMVLISPQLTWTVYRYIQQLVGQFVKVVYLYHIAKANEPNEGLALNKGQCEPNQGLAYNKMVLISPQLTWTVYQYIQQLVGQFVKVVYLYHIAKANEPNEGLALNKGQCEPNQGLAYNKMVLISPQVTWTVYRYIQQLVGQFVEVVYLLC